ncbi:MAG: TIM44-like domain-containing protein [Deltaproteobacteria bacterium]|nr:TIM44-like domain-containing protein [Deltaproteobacteria bacterium]
MRFAPLLAVSLLCLPGVALARAGGGSHYSSGGSSFHSSSSSSFHSSSSSYHPSSSSSYHSSSSSSWGSSPTYHSTPYTGTSYGTNYGGYTYSTTHNTSGTGFLTALVVIVIFIVVMAWIIQIKNRVDEEWAHEDTAYTYNAGPQRPTSAEVEAQVRARDPSFDLDAFRQQVRTEFLAIQEAWFRRNLSDARAYMSDGVLRRFTGQLALMSKEGVRNALADIMVFDVELANYQMAGAYEALDVEIHASARDMDVPASTSDASARDMAAMASPQRFTEIWTFARTSGLQTKPGQNLAGGKCPNCGAAYPGGPTAQCAYCKAVVNSGQFDWVLCSITQEGEERTWGEVPGLAELQAQDPELSALALEDRAQVTFWRIVQARGTATPSLLDAVCGESERNSIAHDIQSRQAQGQRSSYHECAVGGVELLAVDEGEAFDRAHVLVRWSARLSHVALDEKGHAEAPVVSRSTVHVLQRAHGTATRPERGLATERCGNCGASQTHDGGAVCEFCSMPLGAAQTDWVLAGRQDLDAWRAARNRLAQRSLAISEVTPMSERLRLLQTVAAMARADGVVTPKERELLDRISRRWHVDPHQVEVLLDQPQPDELPLPHPNTAEAVHFVEILAATAMADGAIDRVEETLLRTTASELKLPQERIEGILKSARAA